MVPEVQAMYTYLEQLVHEMRNLGYILDAKFVLHDMESEHKDHVVPTYSEKLVVVYEIMKLPLGATIRVFKKFKNMWRLSQCIQIYFQSSGKRDSCER